MRVEMGMQELKFDRQLTVRERDRERVKQWETDWLYNWKKISFLLF